MQRIITNPKKNFPPAWKFFSGPSDFFLAKEMMLMQVMCSKESSNDTNTTNVTHAPDEHQAYARNWSFALLMIYIGE